MAVPENGNANGGAKDAHTAAADAVVKKIVGEERFKRIQSAKLLMIGAGGIGCELLKDLVLTGFQDIEVVDLDTIDVSNLNRQFLFRRHHVDRPKAEVATEVVKQLRPSARIVAHHGNVKDSKFGVPFVSQFDVVINALDNLEARRHVNRLCLAAEKPLLEAGSTGHLGQVTVIRKDQTECFECQAKPTQKVYPYCTIRSTPEKPVHCLTWAKNLFDLCFGPDDESNLLSDLAEEMRVFQAQENVNGEEVGKTIFTALFDVDIHKQAKLEDLWSEKRPPPTPLPYAEASQRTDGAQAKSDGVLDMQRVPAVGADVKGFVAAVATMYTERRSLIGQSVFSKDDQISMDFVHCAANLRMSNYRIDRLSRWDAQSIAGAIIPAVASTNAIVAGLEVTQLVHVIDALAENKELGGTRCRTVWVRYPEPSRKKILQPSTLQKPNKECYVCGASTAKISLRGFAEWKIGDFAKKCMQGAMGASAPALYLNGMCIYDPEYPEAGEEAEEEGMHPEWTLPQWDLVSGSIISVQDEGQGFSCNVIITEDAELDEEAHPAGFRVDVGAEKEEPKRKADDEAAEAPPAKKPAAETVALDD